MGHLSTALALLSLGLLACGSARAEPTVLRGEASVVDGDTLKIHGTRIRMFGIDAPESAQTCLDATGGEYRCGQKASVALSEQIGGRPVTCTGDENDRYGRLIAVCAVDDVDLCQWMVEQGHALAFRRYSKDYIGAEDRAREAKAGVWAGVFIEPWDWRRDKRPPGERETGAHESDKATAPGDCAIKGNISSKGVRIYHLPTHAGYAQTRINQDKGERWFCTEAEAKAAGWRGRKKAGK